MNNIFKQLDSQKIHYRAINEDGSIVDGENWLVTYELQEKLDEYDDSMEVDNNIVEIIITASNFDLAVKYAQQYIRKMQSTDSDWINANILSVQLR